MTEFYLFNKPYSFTPNQVKKDKEIGFIIIHGFTSTTSSVMYLAEKLAQQNYHIEVPALCGHGSTPDCLKNITWDVWIEDIQEAWFKLRKRVDNIYLIGLSMGGTLALNFSIKVPFISGVILINHALYLNSIKYKLVPIFGIFKNYAKGIGSDILDKTQEEIAYKKIPIKAIEQLLELCSDTEEKLFLVNSPILIFKSVKDHIIPIKTAETTFRNLKCSKKRLITLYNSAHVATMDFDKDLIIQETLNFVNNIAST